MTVWQRLELEMREDAAKAVCSVNQETNTSGSVVTHVTCPNGSAKHVVDTRGQQTLVLNSGTPSDMKSSLELHTGDATIKLAFMQKNGAASSNSKHTKLIVQWPGMKASVYCDTKLTTHPLTIAIDRLWSDTVNIDPKPRLDITAHEIQSYASKHPDVIAALRGKVLPVVASIEGYANVTLDQALSIQNPRYEACPLDLRQRGENVIVRDRQAPRPK